VAHPQIAAFARLAKQNTPPVRSIQGQKTLISRTIHGLSYDAIHDEIVTPSPFAQAILTFRGTADGEEAPIRVIQGPHTQILGVTNMVGVDPDNNEILVPTLPAGILVFDREANGDVAPKRVLSGPDTQIRVVRDLTGESPGQAHVDAKRNLLVVNSGGKILIFDRSASGNAKPKAVISGINAASGYNSFQISPKGWIVAGCTAGSICAWTVDNNGESTLRSKIPFLQLTGYQHSGIALDPAHKEIILSAATQKPPNPRPSAGVMNAVITFSWPEIF
jgi:hypothetical protein